MEMTCGRTVLSSGSAFHYSIVLLFVDERLDSTEAKIKVVIVYSDPNNSRNVTDRQKHNIKLPKCLDLYEDALLLLSVPASECTSFQKSFEFFQNLDKNLFAFYLRDCFLCVTTDGDLEAATHKYPLTTRCTFLRDQWEFYLCLSKVRMLVGVLSLPAVLSPSLTPFPPPPALHSDSFSFVKTGEERLHAGYLSSWSV